MYITTEELNELLQKEFERGRDSVQKTISTPDMTKLLIDSIPKDYIPKVCKNCPNHPLNGGSGICNCAAPYITDTITVTNTLSTTQSISTKDYGNYSTYRTC